MMGNVPSYLANEFYENDLFYGVGFRLQKTGSPVRSRDSTFWEIFP
jgi:hypothetical protein